MCDHFVLLHLPLEFILSRISSLVVSMFLCPITSICWKRIVLLVWANVSRLNPQYSQDRLIIIIIIKTLF